MAPTSWGAIPPHLNKFGLKTRPDGRTGSDDPHQITKGLVQMNFFEYRSQKYADDFFKDEREDIPANGELS